MLNRYIHQLYQASYAKSIPFKEFHKTSYFKSSKRSQICPINGIRLVPSTNLHSTIHSNFHGTSPHAPSFFIVTFSYIPSRYQRILASPIPTSSLRNNRPRSNQLLPIVFPTQPLYPTSSSPQPFSTYPHCRIR